MMKKRLIALALTAAATVSVFAGCGSKSESSSPQTATTVSTDYHEALSGEEYSNCIKVITTFDNYLDGIINEQQAAQTFSELKPFFESASKKYVDAANAGKTDTLTEEEQRRGIVLTAFYMGLMTAIPNFQTGNSSNMDQRSVIAYRNTLAELIGFPQRSL